MDTKQEDLTKFVDIGPNPDGAEWWKDVQTFDFGVDLGIFDNKDANTRERDLLRFRMRRYGTWLRRRTQHEQKNPQSLV